jgi:hypothetical protein
MTVIKKLPEAKGKLLKRKTFTVAGNGRGNTEDVISKMTKEMNGFSNCYTSLFSTYLSKLNNKTR